MKLLPKITDNSLKLKESVKIGPLMNLPIYQIEDNFISENLTFNTAYNASVPSNICFKHTIVKHKPAPLNKAHLLSSIMSIKQLSDGFDPEKQDLLIKSDIDFKFNLIESSLSNYII